MTGDERLAKVAEVLAATIEPESHRRTPPPERVNAYVTTLAQALAPLLDEFRAEDEARALRAEDEAWRDEGRGVMFNRDRLDLSPEGRVGKWLRDRVGDGHTCCACFTNNGLPCCNAGHRAALAAAEPDAGAR